MDIVTFEVASVAHRLVGVAKARVAARQRGSALQVLKGVALVLLLEDSLDFERRQVEAIEPLLDVALGFDCDNIGALMQDVLNGLGQRLENAASGADRGAVSGAASGAVATTSHSGGECEL